MHSATSGSAAGQTSLEGDRPPGLRVPERTLGEQVRDAV